MVTLIDKYYVAFFLVCGFNTFKTVFYNVSMSWLCVNNGINSKHGENVAYHKIKIW